MAEGLGASDRCNQGRWDRARPPPPHLALGGPVPLTRGSGEQGSPADPGPPAPKCRCLAASQGSQRLSAPVTVWGSFKGTGGGATRGMSAGAGTRASLPAQDGNERPQNNQGGEPGPAEGDGVTASSPINLFKRFTRPGWHGWGQGRRGPAGFWLEPAEGTPSLHQRLGGERSPTKRVCGAEPHIRSSGEDPADEYTDPGGPFRDGPGGQGTERFRGGCQAGLREVPRHPRATAWDFRPRGAGNQPDVT